MPDKDNPGYDVFTSLTGEEVFGSSTPEAGAGLKSINRSSINTPEGQQRIIDALSALAVEARVTETVDHLPAVLKDVFHIMLLYVDSAHDRDEEQEPPRPTK